MKDILIITSYFPPEIGAASNRIFHLAQGLQKRNFKVSVITPLPNYPTGKIFKEYRGKFKKSTVESNITIHRLWIYATVSKNKFLRLMAMLSYSFSLVWFFVFNKIPNTVIVQSPPLLVAFTSMFFLNKNGRKLILNVSDLWPMTGLKLGVFKNNYSYNLLEKIERHNYRKANLVLGQSNEILSHIKTIFPAKETFLYRNYTDFVTPEINEKIAAERKLQIVYAGLLGVAQGIYSLCKELDFNKIELHIYGSGAEENQIKSFIKANPKLPIYFHGSLSRADLHLELMKHDIAIIPLVTRIYGSVPSKIFEYARLGLPILYFGGGEGGNLVENYKLGWVVEPKDYNGLNHIISTINKSKLTLDNTKVIQCTALRNFDLDGQLEALVNYL